MTINHAPCSLLDSKSHQLEGRFKWKDVLLRFIELGLGLLVGQQKQFENVTLVLLEIVMSMTFQNKTKWLIVKIIIREDETELLLIQKEIVVPRIAPKIQYSEKKGVRVSHWGLIKDCSVFSFSEINKIWWIDNEYNHLCRPNYVTQGLVHSFFFLTYTF